MAVDGLTLQEMQPIDDGPVVHIALGYIGMSSSQMRREKTKSGIVVLQSNTNCPFVTRHTPQTSLSRPDKLLSSTMRKPNLMRGCFNVASHSRQLFLDEHKKGRANQLYKS